MNNSFEGVKVIELASVLAGPLCGSFFAENGAEVIKIEHKTRGDVTRTWRLPKEPDFGPSAYYASANYGKSILRLDLAEREDYANCLAQIESADIVITNFKSGDAERFNLTDSIIRQHKPTLIHGIIRGFPLGDDRPAFDIVLQAETGFLSMTGWPDERPAKMPVALIDVIAAHQLKEGLLLAWINRLKQNEGALVEVSLYDAAISSLINQASNYLMEGHIAQPMGTLHPNIAPYGEVLSGKDGKQLVLAIGNNKQFILMCDALGISELAEDERYLGNQSRVQNRIELGEKLMSASRNWETDILFTELVKKGVPVGRIRTIQEVLDDESATELILRDQLEGKTLKRPKGFIAKITSFKKHL